MNREVVVDNEAVTLWYYPDTQILHHEFHRFIFGFDLREYMESALAFMQEHGVKKWLSDDRNNSGLPQPDRDWLMNDWRPRARQAGWTWWGLVLPKKTLGEFKYRPFVLQSDDDGLIVEVFSDPAAALTWLERQGATGP